MNDSELDRILNSWKAPAVPRSLRRGLRARSQPAQRFQSRPLGWVVFLVLSAALAIGMGQVHESGLDLPILDFLNQIYANWMQGREVARAGRMVHNIMQSDPKVYVDGQLAAPLTNGPAATMVVRIPGNGSYAVSPYRYMQQRAADGVPTGWFEAGRIHGSMLEFQAGGKQVRIECSQPIVDEDSPVFAIRRP